MSQFVDVSLGDLLGTFKDIKVAESLAELEQARAAAANPAERAEAVTDEQAEQVRDVAGNGPEDKTFAKYKKPLLIAAGVLVLVGGIVALVKSGGD